MTMRLRNLPDGTRFMLTRTRQMFILMRREYAHGKSKIVVQREKDASESTMHHSCFVKPVVKAQP